MATPSTRRELYRVQLESQIRATYTPEMKEFLDLFPGRPGVRSMWDRRMLRGLTESELEYIKGRLAEVKNEEIRV